MKGDSTSTGHQIATLAKKLRSFCQTGAFCTLVELHFLVIVLYRHSLKV